MSEPTIELFYYPTANPKKVAIMLEECGIAYRMRFVDIGRGDQFAPEFLKIAPNNRVPAIRDLDGPDGQPITIFESGAILQYLGIKTGRFYPTDLRGRAAVDQWLFWQMAGLGPNSGQSHHFSAQAEIDQDYAKTRFANEVHRLYGVLNQQLKQNEFVAGADYSIADMACYPWLFHNEAPGHPGLSDFPHVARWFEQVGARPSVQRGHTLGDELRGVLDDEARQWTLNQRAREEQY